MNTAYLIIKAKWKAIDAQMEVLEDLKKNTGRDA